MAKLSFLLLRLALGWVFFYSGITKVLNPEWTSAGFLRGAKTFPDLYQWFGSTQNIIWVDFLNQWGLTLIGAALILGVFIRFASICGILLMLLYYLAQLQFPMAGANSYLIDQHIIYILVLLTFIFSDKALSFSLNSWAKNL